MCLEAAEQRHQRRGAGTHLVGQSGEAGRHALVSSDFVNCPPWRHEELTPSLVGSVRLWFERRAGLLQKASPALLAEPIAVTADCDHGAEVQQAIQDGGGDRLTVIEGVGPISATLRLRFSDQHLSPGDTTSGPAMLALADSAMYA